MKMETNIIKLVVGGGLLMREVLRQVRGRRQGEAQRRHGAREGAKLCA